jgi:hypothetical protein
VIDPFITWLIEGGAGPALVAVPVNLAGDAGADAARRWFRRLRRTDDLSRLVKAATGTSVELSNQEFAAVRELLEDPETWRLIGHGTVEDLAAKIASCMPRRVGLTGSDSRVAAMITARGLLEVGIADLYPNVYQRLLSARLQRLESHQASPQDMALMGLLGDLAARSADVLEQLKRVLDQLPPGPADRGEVTVYLSTLISALSMDRWATHPLFKGPALRPSSIKRRLRALVPGQAGQAGPAEEPDLDADMLLKEYQRLVVLGNTGSGKTWLARQAARRCALDALEALMAGAALDEVELPLYTTCSRLFSTRGNIRADAISSALNQVGDLGGYRITEALRAFFAERNVRTVLILDALDEANAVDEQLQQVNSLPWRIVLTSRPGAWNYQLLIQQSNGSHCLAELQPLGYPHDVELFISQWFAAEPESGVALSNQIALRPGIQRAATVPLILAFYCIIGGDQPLPDFQHDLLSRVINRMLTGRWHGLNDRLPDTGACLETLRAWAWSGSAGHAVSGVGIWADDILTGPARLGEFADDALDHVAVPVGPPDMDSMKTPRRFIHRSIREHLVAEYIARLPVDTAVGALLPHVWFDPDWEYSTPAVLAMHPQRDQLLGDLICRAACSDQIPADLSVVDAGWEFRRLLTRVAAESGENDWSPAIAKMIGQARVDFASSSSPHDLIAAVRWETTDSQAQSALLGQLATPADSWRTRKLAGRMSRLAITAEGKRQATSALLGQLTAYTHRDDASPLVEGVVLLAVTAEDKRQALSALLGQLADRPNSYGATLPLVNAIAECSVTAEDKRQALETLLGIIADQPGHEGCSFLIDGVAKLAETAEDLRQARDALLQIAATQTDFEPIKDMLSGVAQLNPTTEDKRQAREALLRVLAGESGDWEAVCMVYWLIKFGPTTDDKRRARALLLRLLASQTRGWSASELTDAVVKLDPTADDKRRARVILLRLLASETEPREARHLVDGLVQLAPTADGKRRARKSLLQLLTGDASGQVLEGVINDLVRLDATLDDKREAREALLGLLTDQSRVAPAGDVVPSLVQLASTAEDKRQIREALLSLLPSQTRNAPAMVLGLVQLASTAEDKREAFDALLGLPLSQLEYDLGKLMYWLVELASTADQNHQARDALFRVLASANNDTSSSVIKYIAQLELTAEHKRQARNTLIGLLPGTNWWNAPDLMRMMATLDPTARDLSTWRSWPIPPTFWLLAAARRNSTLDEWLEVLPLLSEVAELGTGYVDSRS